MTQQELLQSLSTEQGAALNVILEQNFNLRGSAEQAKTLSKQLADEKSERAAAEKAFADYRAQSLAVAAAIHAAVKDPNTDTDSAVTSILAEATKPERDKQRDALLVKKAELDKQLSELS